MSNISDLAGIVAGAVRNAKTADKLQIGRVSGNAVIVNGRSYKPIWGGDFDVATGDRADCVIDGERCLVVRCSR